MTFIGDIALIPNTRVWDEDTLMWVPLTKSGGVGSDVTVTNVPHVVVDSMPAGGGGDASAANQATQIAALGATTDAEASADGSIIALLKRLRTLLASPIAVSGPLTDTQLRASAVPVSGTFWPVTQPVSLASMPSTPVTNANLDAALSTLATGAKQDTGNASVASIDGKITAVDTGAVVVASSALPAGAALEAGNLATLAAVDFATADKQDTANDALAALVESQNRRLDEANYVQNYLTNIHTLIASEAETSQRMGFELR